MSDDPSRNEGDSNAGRRISFDYLKSPHFRVIRADGVIGSVTPSGHIHFAIYNERPAIPRRVVHDIDEDGRLGDEVSDQRTYRSDYVREMEVDVFLTIDAAESLKQWLETRIEDANATHQVPRKKEN